MASIVSVSDAVVSESSSYADFTVRLDQASTTSLSLTYGTFNGLAMAGNDYVAQSGVLTFAPGETVKTVRVSLISDTLLETAENFGLSVYWPTAGLQLGRDRGTVTILDNDGARSTPLVGIGDLVVDEKAHEASFVITLDKPSVAAVTMNYATANGTALAGSDYTAVSGALTFAPGEVTKTVKVALLDDATAENTESFNLVLSSVVGATLKDTGGTAFIAPSDGAVSSVVYASVEDAVVDESDGWADFTVRLNAPSSSAVGLTYSTFNGLAVAGSDYVAQSGVLTFAPGETVKTVRVSLADDTAIETPENFGLSIYWPTAGLGMGRDRATATILDNDGTRGTPLVSIGDLVVDEKAREASFVITLDKPSNTLVALNYTTANGTALAGSDYSATAGVLSFAPGEMSKTIKVALLDDSTVESSESFNLVLSAPVGATLRDTAGTALISASDAAVSSTVRASVEDAVVSESGGWADFIVKLDAPSSTAVGLTYSTFNGLALAGDDYVAQSGVLTFAPGETVKTVRVSLTDDTAIETPENFGLSIYWPTAGLQLGRDHATVTILDNDGTRGTPLIGIDDLVVDEKAREASFVVTLDKPSSTAVTMNYATTDGTALAGSDYSTASGMLTFAPGEMSKTVKVALLDDSTAEDTESFNLVLSAAVGGTLQDTTGVASIAASDAAVSSTVRASVEDAVVSESDGWADFTIRLDAPSSTAVGLTYSTFNGLALAGDDYVAQSGVLTFAPGETVKTVRISLEDDTAIETPENFGLSIYWPTAGLQLGRDRGSVNILDNDGTSGTPLVGIDDLVVDEKARQASIVVTLDKPSSTAVTMNYATANGTALAGSDYSAASGVLSFAPGEMSKTVKVALIDDSTAEGSESFNLVLSTPVGATLKDTAGTVVIAANDGAVSSTVRASVEDAVVSESDGWADFTIRLDAPSSTAVGLTYSTFNGLALAGDDYVAQSGVLTFAPGETVKTVRVSLEDDTAIETPENFGLSIYWPTAGLQLGRDRGSVNILDNDGASGTPLVGIDDLVVDEKAREASFVVTLDKPSSTAVTMNYATADGTALVGSDYNAASGILSFAPGEMSKTVKVALIDDITSENTESFNLVLSAAVGATLKDTTGTALIRANDSAAASVVYASVEDTVVNEADGWADFVVRLSSPSSSAVGLTYSTFNGTALAGDDYVSQSGVLTFAPGETAKTVRVSLSNDTAVETLENLGLSIYWPTAGLGLGRDRATATLVDNDAASGTPAARVGDLVVDETGGGPASLSC